MTYNLYKLYTESNVVIRDCAVDDYGNFCQQFESATPDTAAASTQKKQQQQKKHEICISTCHWSLCNKLPVVKE